MKARIQSVEQLRKVAAESLKEEFARRYEEATITGAVQGMALVMYVLEFSYGWKRDRQQKLFQAILDLMKLSEDAAFLQPYCGADIQEHLEKDYGIDFRKLLDKVAAVDPQLD